MKPITAKTKDMQTLFGMSKTKLLKLEKEYEKRGYKEPLTYKPERTMKLWFVDRFEKFIKELADEDHQS